MSTAAQREEKESIDRLPVEVLLPILSRMEEPDDLSSFLSTSCGMLALPEDSTLALKAMWLLRHRPESAVSLAASDSVDAMFELFRLGRSTTQPELRDGQQVAPLPIAVLNGHAKVAKYLCSREEVCADDLSLSKALFYSVCWSQLDCMKVVLAVPGVDVNASLEGNPHGYNALHLAAQVSNVEIVELLLLRGADRGSKDCFGHVSLHLASYNRDDQGASIIRTLLSGEGKDFVNEPDYDGNLPILGAHLQRRSKCCEELLSAGADAQALDGLPQWITVPSMLEALVDGVHWDSGIPSTESGSEGSEEELDWTG